MVPVRGTEYVFLDESPEETQYSSKLEEKFMEDVKKLEAVNLVKRDGDEFYLTEKGEKYLQTKKDLMRQDNPELLEELQNRIEEELRKIHKE